MRILLSGNMDAEVGDAFAHARKRVEKRVLRAISGKNYGGALNLIAVIPTISN